ncbi:MAG: CSLREA domain-containing protein [bacterium]
MNLRTASALIVAVLTLGHLGPASIAATFTVTRFDDPSVDACAPEDCSLREAVIAANAASGADEIDLPGGTYLLTRPGTNENDSASGDLDISESVTILGPPGSNGGAVIDAQRIDRVFDVRPGAATVEFRDLIIRGGEVSLLDEPADQESSKCAPGSTGRYACGGGIKTAAAVLTLTRCTVTDNTAIQGGGLYTVDLDDENKPVHLEIVDSTVSDNVAVPGGGPQANDGGGLYNGNGNRSLVSVTITRSTFSGNSTPGRHGGAIANDAGETLDAVNSTFSGNRAALAAAVKNSGLLSLTDCSLIGNLADGAADALESTGPDGVTLRNTLIEGDCATAPPGGLPASQFHSQDGNIESPGNTCALFAPNDRHGVASLGVKPIGDYGGPTRTHALDVGSIAVDSGIGPCTTTDQRNKPRSDAHCDTGAVEAQADERESIAVTELDDPEPDGCISGVACSLREAVIAANAQSNAATILLAPGSYELTRPGADEDDALLGDLDIRQPLTLRGAGVAVTVIKILGGDRLFNPKGGGGPIKFAGFTMTGGSVQGNGGAIASSTDMSLEDVRIVGNQATGAGAKGGGIYSDGSGSLHLDRVTVEANTAESAGGGIFVESPLLVAADGGAPQAIIDASLLAENTVASPQGEGGGLANGSGDLIVRNSTLSGNEAPSGAAITNGGDATLAHVIVAENQGASAIETTGEMLLRNSGIQGTCQFPSGRMTANLGTWGDPSCPVVDGNHAILDLGLLRLAYNGGPTKTYLLKSDSKLVVDGVQCTHTHYEQDACNDLDQRASMRASICGETVEDGAPACSAGSSEAVLTFESGFETGTACEWSSATPSVSCP